MRFLHRIVVLLAMGALLTQTGCRHRSGEPLDMTHALGTDAIPEGWPADASSFLVNDEFGPRPPGPWSSFHKGIDLNMPEGTPIHATADGIVTYSGLQSNYGELVVLQHAREFATAYAHLRRRHVKRGDLLGKGECLGECGCTGNATGPHLHYEVRQNGAPVNPRGYLPIARP